MRRIMFFGSSNNIVNANKNLARTHFVKLTPDRSKKVSVNTIPGISHLCGQLVNKKGL